MVLDKGSAKWVAVGREGKKPDSEGSCVGVYCVKGQGSENQWEEPCSSSTIC